MFSPQERARVQARLLHLAEADPAISAAAVTGSQALGRNDAWSDIDLAFALRGDDSAPVLERWTDNLYAEFGAVHHWDLRADSWLYRVFLLPDWLEADLAFAPEADFGPLGPSWQPVFGTTATPAAAAGPEVATVTGMSWHHLWHARVCIARERWWQAEHWIGAARERIIALACLRHGLPAAHAKGAHGLPGPTHDALAGTLAGTADAAGLTRALAALVAMFQSELEYADPVLATRMRMLLRELRELRDDSGGKAVG